MTAVGRGTCRIRLNAVHSSLKTILWRFCRSWPAKMRARHICAPRFAPPLCAHISAQCARQIAAPRKGVRGTYLHAVASRAQDPVRERFWGLSRAHHFFATKKTQPNDLGMCARQSWMRIRFSRAHHLLIDIGRDQRSARDNCMSAWDPAPRPNI